MTKKYLILIIAILISNTALINSKENNEFYIVWYCSLKESPLDKSGAISLYPGDEVQYLNEDSEESEEIFKWSEKNSISTKYLKVKTENDEVGWIPEAFAVKKNIIDNLNSSKISKTVKILINKIEDMNKKRFYTKQDNDLDNFMDQIISKKYKTVEHDDYISHLYGKGYKFNYCIAALISYINPGSYYEENSDDSYGIFYITFILPVELKDELYEELINKYGEPSHKPDGDMTGSYQTMWLTENYDGFCINSINYDPDMNDMEKIKKSRFFIFTIGTVAM